MLFQATSSRQMSSIKVLVTTEMPGAPTAEALWDIGTRSAAVVSKPTWGITRSQAEIRSIGRQAKTRLHRRETKWWELPRQSGLPLYMWCELTASQVRLVQEPQQRRKNCKQYLKPWQGWICACVLERTGRGSVGTCGGVIRCWSKFLSWVVFDIFGETQGLPLLWTSEEESVWKSYKKEKKKEKIWPVRTKKNLCYHSFICLL